MSKNKRIKVRDKNVVFYGQRIYLKELSPIKRKKQKK